MILSSSKENMMNIKKNCKEMLKRSLRKRLGSKKFDRCVSSRGALPTQYRNLLHQENQGESIKTGNGAASYIDGCIDENLKLYYRKSLVSCPWAVVLKFGCINPVLGNIMKMVHSEGITDLRGKKIQQKSFRIESS